MKKFLTVILAVCLAAVTGMVAFAAENTFTNFDAEDIDDYMQYQKGLSAWGITPPVLTKVADGVQVECDGSASVQTFLIADEATVAAAAAFVQGGNAYLRVALKAGEAGLSLRITFDDADNGSLSFNSNYARLLTLDGTELEFTTTDGGGIGEGTGIVVPANFEGYVIFALEDLYMSPPETWARPAFNEGNMIGGKLEIDIRGAQNSTYVLKSVVATDSDTVDGEEPAQNTPAPTNTPAQTDAPVATADAQNTEDAAAPTATPDTPGDFPVVWAIVAGVLVVAAVVILLATKKKK